MPQDQLTPMTSEPILEIRDLKTHFMLDTGTVRAVDGIDLTISRGKTLGVIGESGCGKAGTAQVPNRPDDDAWFIAFAPYQEPKIAVAVVVEAGGPGGARAGPVARRVIEAYLESSGYDFGDGPTAALRVSQ